MASINRRDAQKHKIGLPNIPDLRFEQGYLSSLSPFIHLKSLKKPKSQAVDPIAQAASVSEEPYKSYLEEEGDLVIQWKSVVYVTVRDQLVSPLLQGAVWGVGSLVLAASLTSIRLKFPLFDFMASPRRWFA